MESFGGLSTTSCASHPIAHPAASPATVHAAPNRERRGKIGGCEIRLRVRVQPGLDQNQERRARPDGRSGEQAGQCPSRAPAQTPHGRALQPGPPGQSRRQT